LVVFGLAVADEQRLFVWATQVYLYLSHLYS
jgi:hypothetical protein